MHWSRQTRNIRPTPDQCWASVVDAGPTLIRRCPVWLGILGCIRAGVHASWIARLPGGRQHPYTGDPCNPIDPVSLWCVYTLTASPALYSTAVPRHRAVSAYFTSKQMLPFASAVPDSQFWDRLHPSISTVNSAIFKSTLDLCSRVYIVQNVACSIPL